MRKNLLFNYSSYGKLNELGTICSAFLATCNEGPKNALERTLYGKHRIDEL